MTEISMKKPSIPRARQLRISVAVSSHIPSLYLESCRCKAANALGCACALTFARTQQLCAPRRRRCTLHADLEQSKYTREANNAHK